MTTCGSGLAPTRRPVLPFPTRADSLSWLRADMESAAVAERIEANRALAQALGVTGTPAFFVTGRTSVAPGAVETDGLAEMIRTAH